MSIYFMPDYIKTDFVQAEPVYVEMLLSVEPMTS